jgi:hypothetical protein
MLDLNVVWGNDFDGRWRSSPSIRRFRKAERNDHRLRQ